MARCLGIFTLGGRFGGYGPYSCFIEERPSSILGRRLIRTRAPIRFSGRLTTDFEAPPEQLPDADCK